MLMQFPRLHLELTESRQTFNPAGLPILSQRAWPACQTFPARPVNDSTFRLPRVQFVMVIAVKRETEQLKPLNSQPPVLH
ncbi:hypothetical protein L4174_023155 [Photobacterium sp. CCB-ST2H9]|uniref:hypothetical protein n=1 Tax=Photobacterium sp. CCB-ST2H9 TaxID=2912855 RepID=UPI0020046077|nr:hypothetical protein [Photobacterium sp. CCB-ST2H9]UTM59596.1 hypothetical protein L4174_023155 [Photobacterium sp. CCB-ST2H9]